MAIGTTTNANATNAGNNVSVTFASNGTALVSWYDGTNVKVSYASSPYTSWTSLTASAASGIISGQRLDVSDTVNLILYISGGLDYVPITLSGTTYSVGSLTQIASVAGGGNVLTGAIIEKDPQNRYWAVASDRVGGNVNAYDSSTPTTAGWTVSNTTAWSSGTFNEFPAGGIVGNFLLYIYPSASSTFQYKRIDVHNASLGSWSSATAFTPGGTSVTSDKFFSFRGNSTTGVQANDSGNGIWARVYDPVGDTFATAIQLSSGANDAKPTVIAGSDGNFYVLWQSFIASNNFAIVYKKFNVGTTTWDTSATTLVASGANNFSVSGGSNNGQLGIVYQTGTATPWTINFANFSFLTTTTYTFTDALTATDSLLKTDGAQATDALSVSDSAFYADVVASTESLIASETAFYVESSALTDALSVSENLLSSDLASATDTLSVSDSVFQTDGALPTDNLSIVDIGNLQRWPIDALSAADSLLQTDGTLSTDLLSASDVFTQQGVSSLSENLSAIDALMATDGTLVTDANALSDNAIFADMLVGTEPLIVSDSEFVSDIYLPLDILTITTSGPDNNLVSFTNGLSIDDQFLQVDGSAFSDSSPCSDVFASSLNTMATDALVMSDTASYLGLLATTEPLQISDSSAFSDAYLPMDTLTVQDSLSNGNQSIFGDNLSVLDLFMQSSTTNQTESLSALDVFLAQAGVSLVDIGSIDDRFSSVSGLLSMELLTGNDAFFASDLVNVLEVYPISDVFDAHSVQITIFPFIDQLLASDILMSADVLLALEALTATDSLTSSQIAPLARTLISALALNGLVLAHGKSGWIVAQSRDGVAIGKGR